MAELSGKETQTAWEDYKVFLESLGMRVGKGEEMAYKHGFVKGVERTEKIMYNPAITITGNGDAAEIDKMVERMKSSPGIIEPVGPIAWKGEPPLHRIAERRRRSATASDRVSPSVNTAYIKSVLDDAKGPLTPSEITEAIADKYKYHWARNSATSYIKTAMRHNDEIVQLDKGLYCLRKYANIQLEAVE